MASGTSPWTLKHLASVPYSDPPSRLRTLDVWLPQPPAGSSDKGTAPPSDSGTWLVYIHGGAWRDPLKDSRCIEPALSHLSSDASATSASTLNHVTGVASLNYRLSPYPSHPSHPSDPNDAERSARHPTHVRDVAAGLRFLQRQHGMKRWIGIGHSCGATLLAQLVSGIGLDEQGGGETSFAGGPEALILLEGIYNIPLMLKNHSPPGCPQNIADIYKTFVAEAFGDDNNNGAAYLAVSPVSGKYNVQQWPEGKLLVLCHSYDDELVERAQRDVMCVALDREGWSIVMEVGDEEDEVRAEGRRVLNVRDLQGRHDWIWEDGKQIATLILEVVQRLMKR